MSTIDKTDKTEFCLICGNRGATICGCCGVEFPAEAEELIAGLTRTDGNRVVSTTNNATDTLGACPDCGGVTGYLNADRLHRAYCEPCRTTWVVGSNLFSGWREETEDGQRERWERVFGDTAYRDVSPLRPREKRITGRRLRLVDSHLADDHGEA